VQELVQYKHKEAAASGQPMPPPSHHQKHLQDTFGVDNGEEEQAAKPNKPSGANKNLIPKLKLGPKWRKTQDKLSHFYL